MVVVVQGFITSNTASDYGRCFTRIGWTSKEYQDFQKMSRDTKGWPEATDFTAKIRSFSILDLKT
jgi:hypothetical protein